MGFFLCCFWFVLQYISTFLYVAARTDGMNVPQRLHEGSINLDIAVRYG